MKHTREGNVSRSGTGSRRLRVNTLVACASVGTLFLGACGDKEVPPSPPCEQECRDAVALRALRQTMKYAFNKTLQGKPVGYNDETTNEFIPVPAGFIPGLPMTMPGSARVFGEATSNADLGTTELKLLTYVFSQAVYAHKDTEPRENFIMVVDGTIMQKGTLAVQPSSPTSLIMSSASITLIGRVYDPPLDYAEFACPVELNQNGNAVSGFLCGRFVGFEF
jgi:hypothetical protein